MTDRLTYEQLQYVIDGSVPEQWMHRMATELLALRAERAKPNDSELVDQIQSMQEDLDTLRSERTKLKAVLTQARHIVARYANKTKPSEASEIAQKILEQVDAALPLAQPAKSVVAVEVYHPARCICVMCRGAK